MAPVGLIQRHLERIYAIDPGCSAERFVVTARAERGDAEHRPEEELLLRQQDDVLELALYLSAGLLERLQRDDPLTRLHDGNLADLCLVTEGVSHFLYVAWRAGRDQPVTALELELQAEVDKFVLALLLLGRRAGTPAMRGLHGRLFRGCRIAEPLPHAVRQRYHRANAYAAHYCDYLLQRFLESGDPRALVRELRRFYRLRQREKLGHIAARTRPH